MFLAQNLKRLIEKNNMTVAQLSRETGVPVQTIHNWLYGMEPRSIRQV
jgi:transcriptional regulator with XRE-family HTH domain